MLGGRPVAAGLDDACGDRPGAACEWVLRQTDSEALAAVANWLVARPLKIAIILLVAIVAYRLINRAIGRFIRGLGGAAMQRTLENLNDAGGSLVTTGPLNERALRRAETVAAVLRSLARGAIAVATVLMVLGEVGIFLGPLLAGAGIVGVALGFGAQSLVKDFLSGMFMIVEDQFGVGDIIDVGDASGVVEGVSLRTTRLRDVEGTVWHLPNGEIKRVGNKSQQWSRALLDVSVTYDTDLEVATRIIKEVADGVWQDEAFADSVLEEPEVWGVEGFGPSGIAIRLVVKTKPAEQWNVLRELRQRLKAALGAAGIEIGFARQQFLQAREAG